MTALKDLPQGAAIPSAGIQNGAVSSRKAAFAAQRDYGNNVGMGAALVTQVPVKKDASNDLAISWTPPYDAYWEINGHVGLLQEITSGYFDCHIGVSIVAGAVPAGWSPNSWGSVNTQHPSVSSMMERTVHAIFGLTAGVAYTAKLLPSFAGGQWQLWQGPEFLMLSGKGWAR